MLTIAEYVHKAKIRLREEKYCRLVFGNEACDLDSFSCSLAYAFLADVADGQTNDLDSASIPVLSIEREDLRLRPEHQWLMRQTGINSSDLIFLDDIVDVKECDVTLVDHNVLPQCLKHVGRVSAIIDHHADEGSYHNANPRIITPSGSCTSLVVEHFERELHTATKSLKLLLLAAIHIDTQYMTNRVTEHDRSAVRILQHPFDKDFYTGLVKAKQETKGMSIRDILRRDYKEFEPGTTKVGMSAITESLQTCTSRKDWYSDCQKWIRERALLLHIVTTTTGSGQDFAREILIWSSDSNFFEKFEVAGQELHLSKLSCPADWAAWKQENVQASRKQIAPIVKSILS